METHNMEDIQQRKWDTHTPPCPGLPQQQGRPQETRPGQGHQQSLPTTTKNRARKIPNTVQGKGGFVSTTFSDKCRCAKTCENLKFTFGEGRGTSKDAVEKTKGKEGWADAEGARGAGRGKQDGPRERLQTSRRWRGGGARPSQSGSPRGEGVPPLPPSPHRPTLGTPRPPVRWVLSPTPVARSHRWARWRLPRQTESWQGQPKVHLGRAILSLLRISESGDHRA